jgi:hypothetical protein
MEKYSFHRDDIVPENIDTKEKLKNYLNSNPERKFKKRDRVRNINNLDIVMIISDYEVVNNKLIGFKCYWWE